MDWQETEQARQDRLRFQKNLRTVTWICISIGVIALIVALILSNIGMKPLDPPIETWLLPMWIVGSILFLTGVFWERVKKFVEFGSSKQGPVYDQFQRCLYFTVLSIFGCGATFIGAPLYHSLIFFAFSALGFYLTFPTSERVAKLARRLKEKEQKQVTQPH